MNLDQWRARVAELHPTAQFTQEDGTSITYGDDGSWTAHTGPDMQADVVGVYVPSDFCWVLANDEFEEHGVE